MPHHLYIILDVSRQRLGSIQAVNAQSALRGFREAFAGRLGVPNRGLTARKATEGERA